MKKKFIIFAMICMTAYTQTNDDEHDSDHAISIEIVESNQSNDSDSKDNDPLLFPDGHRAPQQPQQPTPPPMPKIDFSKPLIFNPNNTPHPTQPAAIADISRFIMYVSGAHANQGPFGGTTSTLNQLNSLNNSILGLSQQSQGTGPVPSQANANQIITPPANSTAVPTNNMNPSQVAALQANATAAAGIALSINSAIPTSAQLNQQAGFSSATNNASQAAVTIQPYQQNASHPLQQAASTIANAQITPPAPISNPNPFITINNPTPRPRIVTWNAPLIIDHRNPFFDTMSTVTFQENIVYNPGLNYNYGQYSILTNSTTGSEPSLLNLFASDYPAAIIIARDNITIDLNGFNLSLDPRSSCNFLTNNPTYGISILPGIKNVRIISTSPTNAKGSITGFCGFGIYAQGLPQFTQYNEYLRMIKDLTIDNILIAYNFAGISVKNAIQVNITNSEIIYNSASQIVCGIYFDRVQDAIISKTISNLNHSFFDVFGIYLQDTIGVTVDSCQTSFNKATQIGNCAGIEIVATSAVSSHDNTITNCFSDGNLCSLTQGKESTGYYIKGASYNNTISNCITNSSSHGSSNLPAPGIPPTGYGIKLDGATQTNIINKNICSYHDDYGIFDSACPSTSYFTQNQCLFNGNLLPGSLTANYSVLVPTAAGPYGVGIPPYLPPGPYPTNTTLLPTTIVYPSNLTAYTGSGATLQNIEAQAYPH